MIRRWPALSIQARPAPLVLKLPTRAVSAQRAAQYVNYHMAYVGTVGFVDVDGGFLATRKYAATHHEGPEGIVARMTADVRAAKLRPSEDITTQPEALEAQKGA